MPSTQIRIGVPQIFLSIDNGVTLPDISAVVPTVVSATPTDFLNNDVNQPLLTTDDYNVRVGLVGMDMVNKGYTVGKCTAALVSTVSPGSAGDGLTVNIANGDWPSGFDSAVCAVIFLKTNAGSYQLCDFAYIDPIYDMNFMVTVKPLRVAPIFLTALLSGTTADPILGSRVPKGISWQEITPTTGQFSFRRQVVTVGVSPNNSPDYQIATGRSTSVTFQALVNDVKQFVRAAAGVYVQFVGDNDSVITNAKLGLNTAQAIIRGNRPLLVFLPPDQNGDQEVRLLLGLLTFNQIELEEAWNKGADTPVNFNFEAASLDLLLTDSHTELQYLRRN